MIKDWPLRVKVPLFIGGGLLVVIATWTWVSYNNVRHAMMETGEARLATVTTQFADVYRTQIRGVGTSLRTGTSRGAIADYVRGTGTRDSAAAALRRAITGSTRRAALFALDGTPMVTVPDTQAASIGERHEELAETFKAAIADTTMSAVAPLRLLSDSVALPFVTAVLKDGQPAAYLVLWRGLTSSQTARQQLAQLVGADAHTYIGNERGDLWSDFGSVIKSFPVALPLDSGHVRYVREDGVPVLAAGRRIAGTPWTIAVEFAEAEVMQPADDFLRTSIILGLVVLAASTFAAWRLSRRVTIPLHELTNAAAAIAQGEATRNVTSDRRDEIGVLADSFNRMVNHVAAAHSALEVKVEERTQELQERNEELEAFAHSVSHDLRAPLRAMHGFSQALVEDCADQLGPDGLEYVKRIAAASQRMDVLTQDLLAYSRVSRTEMALTVVELATVVANAMGQLEADMSARGARVAVDDGLPRAIAHKPVLEQVVANLLSNGLKFVPSGRNPEIRISAERVNGRVRLWVQDNGIGIDPSHHQRIFSVFERLHANEQYAGTGIGLAIVRKGVERMGGHVGVESALGAGSRFWVELKAAEAVA
ncbi:MAG TPA: ATP-binding protein [Gemmatimonadaceae bacterium]|nr:ATP-binding protein [Gemmatimonadaceae bacterium]